MNEMKETTNRQIKVGAILSYVSIAVSIIAGLLYTPWIVGRLGQSQYGLYTLANSLIALFMIDFGLSAATSRYVSKYRAEGNEEKAERFLGAIYKLYIFIDSIIFIALVFVFLFIYQIYLKLTPAELEQFKVVYIIASSYALLSFPFVTLNGILNAYEKFTYLKLADLAQRILVVISTIVALICGAGLYGLVAVNAICGLLIIVYKLIVIKKTTSIHIKFNYKEKGLYKEIFSFSLWATLSSLAARMIFNITPTILGIFNGSAEIAVFGIITSIEGYFFLFTSAINGMFMPKISRIYANTDEESDIMPLMLRVGRFQYGLNGLLITGFAVLGVLFITLWLGEGYSDAYLGVLLVASPSIFYNSLQIANTAMVVRKKVKQQSFIFLSVGVFNIICCFILSKYLGLIGACASICGAFVLRAIICNIVYKRVLGLYMKEFYIKCYIRMSIPIILTIACGIGLNMVWNSVGWLVFLAKGFIVVAVYITFVFLLALSKNERSKFIQIIKNIPSKIFKRKTLK